MGLHISLLKLQHPVSPVANLLCKKIVPAICNHRSIHKTRNSKLQTITRIQTRNPLPPSIIANTICNRRSIYRTLHSTPDTRHPTPYTLHPKHETPNPKPETTHHALFSRNLLPRYPLCRLAGAGQCYDCAVGVGEGFGDISS